MEQTEEYVLHTYNRFPVVMEKGEGVHLYDVDGKEYIALLPLEDETVLIYEYNEKEDGDVELGLIEDDDVFEKVSNTFYEIWDDEEDDEEE